MSTACESLSKATLESGLSQRSNSRKARCRPSARPHAIQEEFDGSLSPSFLDLWTGCDGPNPTQPTLFMCELCQFRKLDGLRRKSSLQHNHLRGRTEG